ncbi:FAD-dependent oxidoreductase [Terrarubrum flagellatum]|uniref:FAD-dependent oxidoreductase n=1 Tax=Terrirubrum flagellatum TaxID=2895980 RepID=UPI003144FAAC
MIVCGAGVIGVATAYELVRRGFEVIVVDQRDGPARGDSVLSGGLIASGAMTPWAAPGVAWRYLTRLGDPVAPLIWRPRASLAQWRWLGRFLLNCNARSFRLAKLRAQRLVEHARECLRNVRAELAIEYEATQGVLQLFRTEKDKGIAAPALAALRESGAAFQWLDPDLSLAIEPGLVARRTPFAGALFFPDDEAGDGALFAERLAARLDDSGVEFRYDARIESIAMSDDRGVVGVALRDLRGRGEFLDADAVVLAAGIDSAALAKSLGLDLLAHPVKGCAMTLRVANEAFAPRAALIDEAYRTSVIRLGDRVQVAGTFELSGDELTPRGVLCNTLLKVARDWFPQGVAIPVSPRFQVGRRAMTPDGSPILGPTRIPGLFLNVGHGDSGWAMALGAGAVVADIIAGEDPGIDLEGLTIERFGGGAQAAKRFASSPK